ncbi:MAG: hypothetical protein IJV98_05480 [Clostridia bacterium]|nr:hypothetical protein [Clostridia bacterium]
MKRFTKLLCLIMTVSLVLSMFVSCDGKGGIVAVYDDIPVYESEVQDIINYNLINYYTANMTENDIELIMRDAVKTYVRYLALERDLAALGFTIDEDELEERVKATKNELEKGMGYKKWRESYRVSKDFLEEDVRRYMLSELYAEALQDDIKVTEQEAREYYQVNAIDQFATHAGYYWTSILRPVRDVNDEAERAEAKKEMDDYLAKIKAGTMTLDQVKEELAKKYNAMTGYPNAMYAGEDFTSASAIIKMTNDTEYQEALDDIDAIYANRDPNADEKSEEYKAYMNYLGNVFQATTYYALQTLEPGQVWESTIQSFVGCYIVRLDKIETTNNFIPYEEVSGTIIETLMAQKLQEDFTRYFEALDEKYAISYIFEAASIA